ncbi:MAG: UDP-2,3-diacylglucosamine diphosphatase [Thermoguttaceae bacterium]|nr:UDP-2,3-diacylglucosamine diphosphatase [Thermoguttaceae bacterium]
MTITYRRSGKRVRSLFVSDVHLGCPHSRAAELCHLLDCYWADRVYLVGDFIDGWKLRRSWRWNADCSGVLQRLLELRRGGTELCYAPGNHDAFLRSFLGDLGVVRLADRFIHVSPGGCRYLVVHGDQYDWIESHAAWLSAFSSHFYDGLLTANRWINRVRRNADRPYALCRVLKVRVKALVRHFSQFERELQESARAAGCDGVICGHIHQPKIERVDEMIYCNVGDWVENCSAIVEHENGELEVVYYDGTAGDRLADPGRRRPTPLVPEPDAAAATSTAKVA